MPAYQTTITATLVDLGGIVWKNAYCTVIFHPTPSPGPYIWQGGTYLQMANFQADINGYFSINLADNMTIAPSGSTWQFVISPSASMPAVVFNLQAAGPSMDISSVFTSQSYQLQNTLVQSTPLPRAYNNAEVIIPPFDGQLYFNTSLKEVMVWFNNVWNPLGAGSGGGGGCIGSATQILWLPTDNQCAGDPLFLEQGNPTGTNINGGLHYSGNGMYMDAEYAGSYYFTANDPYNTSPGACSAQFNLTCGGTNSSTFGVRCDTSSGTGSEANAGNINLYTTGNSTNGNNIFLTAIANPLHGGSGNITLESYGHLLLKADYVNISLQSAGGIILNSGSQATTFGGGIAPTTIAISTSPYTVGSSNETTGLYNASSAPIVANLPTTANDGRIFVFKKVDSSSFPVTIEAAAGIIDGATNYVLNTQYQSVTLAFDNPTASWHIIAKI